MALRAPVLVRCMHDSVADARNANGACAWVHWLPDVSPDNLRAQADAILAEHRERIYTAVLVASGDGYYVAESYTAAGMHIQFCGHGALAAAWFVLHECDPAKQSVAFMSTRQHWQARRCESVAADIALLYARPAPVACPVPGFASRCLGGQPLAAAEVGVATDYLIMEMDSVATVQKLRPNLALLTAATQRALIVTARDTCVASAVTDPQLACVFRYFAPQHGVPEDAATGSAAVQLAAYWAPRLPAGPVTLRQLSPQGAVMQVQCSADTVELRARVGYG